MAKNTLELYDYIDDHDAERATSLLLNPNDRKLSQCLNGYDRATSYKQRRRRTALLAALCLAYDPNDQASSLSLGSIGRAINRLCDTSQIDEVNDESVADFIAYMKTDPKGQKIMREVVDKLKSMSNDTDELKVYRKYEVRLTFLQHKPKADVPFKIIWD